MIDSSNITVQPLQGCCITSPIFRGLKPTVIHIKPVLGFRMQKSEGL